MKQNICRRGTLPCASFSKKCYCGVIGKVFGDAIPVMDGTHDSVDAWFRSFFDAAITNVNVSAAFSLTVEAVLFGFLCHRSSLRGFMILFLSFTLSAFRFFHYVFSLAIFPKKIAMSDALIAAGISFGWPALSLFEIADKRNIAGGLAAWVAAIYLRETPLLAYGAGAAIFGVSTYYVAKKNKYVQEVIAFRGAKQSKKISDVGLLAMYVGSNKVLASFVTVFVAVSKSTATDQSN